METILNEGLPLRWEALQAANQHKDQLLVRAQAARVEAETAQQRLAFLAEASTWLVASLNYETTLARLPRLAVPFLADWCAVYVTEVRAIAPSGGGCS